MKYIVFESGGKQYRASEGDILQVERIPAEKDKKIVLEKVLLYTNDGKTQLGRPFLTDLKVEASVVDHVRGEKIRVAKFKAKSRYRKVIGHRQALTAIKIEKIEEAGKSSTNVAKEAEVQEKKPKTTKK